MSAAAYRRLLGVTVALGLVAGLWLLPRGFSFGSTVPPQPIELRSTQPVVPSASPTPAASAVDDDYTTDDDGDDRDAGRATPRRADLRGQRPDEPAPGRADDEAVDDDDDDDGPDDSDDDDDEGDDD
jgi:hypothetical protein